MDRGAAGRQLEQWHEQRSLLLESSGGGPLSKVQSNDPNTVTIEVVAANGQASDILEIKSHAGAVLFQVDKDGNVRVPGDVILVNGSALSAAAIVISAYALYRGG